MYIMMAIQRSRHRRPKAYPTLGANEVVRILLVSPSSVLYFSFSGPSVTLSVDLTDH